jgi:ATP-dependent DNA helicase RecG
MDVEVLSSDQVTHLISRQEGHYIDYKSKLIPPSGLTKPLSAFANADGGELLIGVEEPSKGVYVWDGFTRPEDANGHIQSLESYFPYGNDFNYEFLEDPNGKGIVLRIAVLKTRDIRKSSDGVIYIRRGAQSLPVTEDAKIRKLELAKGSSLAFGCDSRIGSPDDRERAPSLPTAGPRQVDGRARRLLRSTATPSPAFPLLCA